MSDLSFVDKPVPQRSDQELTRDILRDGLKRKLSLVADDFEQAQSYARQLIREGGDLEEELADMEVTARGLLLATLLLQREAVKFKEAPDQFWQAAE